jgi:hypothetical protein
MALRSSPTFAEYKNSRYRLCDCQFGLIRARTIERLNAVIRRRGDRAKAGGLMCG